METLRTSTIRFRVSQAELDLYRGAALSWGLSTSAYIRSQGLRFAKDVLEKRSTEVCCEVIDMGKRDKYFAMRVSEEEKKLFEAAAQMWGRSLSEFVRLHLTRISQDTVLAKNSDELKERMLSSASETVSFAGAIYRRARVETEFGSFVGLVSEKGDLVLYAQSEEDGESAIAE